MKKFLMFSLVFVFMPLASMASDMIRPAGGYYETKTQNCEINAMRDKLDDAVYNRRAVITVVNCDARPAVPAPAPQPSTTVAHKCGCASCGCSRPVERVVNRRYFVEETIQRYEPVVHYVPAGEYTVRRPVCTACDM